MHRHVKLFLLSAAVLGTLAVGDSRGASLAFSDSLRRSMNEDRLDECDPGFAARVRAVIHDLESCGFKPRIVESWRSRVDQRRAVASGRSLVTFGFHNVVGPHREPRAFAVDLVESPERPLPALNYAFKLYAIAARYHLNTGLFWGLSSGQREAVYKAMAKPGAPAPLKIGWDPCHLQPADMTLAQVLENVAAASAPQGVDATR